MPWVNLKELVEQTGYGKRTLEYLVKDEPQCFVSREGRKGREYKQPDTAILLRKREVEKAKEREDPSSEQEARVRKLSAEAAQEELKLAKLRGQLLAVDDWEREFVRRIEPIGVRLKALPGRVAPQLVELASATVAEHIVDGALQEALTDIQRHAKRADRVA